MERKAGVSICGCGFLGVYAMGAMQCILKRAPHYAERIECIYGSSSGSWIAVWIACGLDLDFLYKWVEQQIVEARQYKMGLLNPTFGMYRRMEKLLSEHLPRKAHRISRGRLKVSMTVLPQWENWIVSSFNTRKELINAVIASGFLPGYSEVRSFPVFRGKRCIDSGFTCNQPGADDPHVITISPFSGESDICPRGESASPHLVNIFGMSMQICARNTAKGWQTLLPNSWEDLDRMHRRGYQDALRFLQIEGLLSPLKLLQLDSEMLPESQGSHFPEQPETFDVCDSDSTQQG